MTPSSSIVNYKLFTFFFFFLQFKYLLNVTSYLNSVAESPNQSKNFYEQTVVQLSGFNPYVMMQQQPQKILWDGWNYFFGYPTHTGPSTRQFEGKEVQLRQQTQVAPAPAPAPAPVPTPASAPATCGRGPTKFPGTRSLISGRITAGTDVTQAKNNAWPFLAS